MTENQRRFAVVEANVAGVTWTLLEQGQDQRSLFTTTPHLDDLDLASIS
jgi:hypothetical protein